MAEKSKHEEDHTMEIFQKQEDVVELRKFGSKFYKQCLQKELELYKQKIEKQAPEKTEVPQFKIPDPILSLNFNFPDNRMYNEMNEQIIAIEKVSEYAKSGKY